MNSQMRRSIICPNCRRLINADEPRCPHCGIARPGAAWKRALGLRSLRDPQGLIRTIIGINIAMYALSLLFNGASLGFGANPLTFLAPDDTSLFLLGATGAVPIDRLGRWWTLLAANYLHGGLLHIFFNMMALRQLAPFIAREYGPARLIILYTVGGILGFWVSYLAGVRFTIGASSALCALIGAILFYGKSRGGVYGQAVFKQVGIWALVIFGLGLLLPGINNWGHGGGILAGAGLGWVLGYEDKKAETATHRSLAAVCAAATAGVLAWAIVSAFYHRILG